MWKRLDWLSILLGALAGMQAGWIIYYGGWVVILSLAACIACVAAIFARDKARTLRRLVESLETMTGKLPQKVTFDRDDEGHVTALVTTLSGEPAVIAVPDEVAVQGPGAAMAWVFEQQLERRD